MNRRVFAVLIALTMLIAVGCERRGNEQRETILDAISKSESAAREFEYSAKFGGQEIVVQGVVKDDLSYQVRASLDTQLMVEEAVVDDAHAIRIVDPNGLPRLGIQVSSEALAAIQPLQQGLWVVDPIGSASLQTPERKGATDVILEALTSLRSTAAALAQAQEARVFNPEAIDYRPQEDPFPRANLDNGEIRYDLLPPPMPPRQDPRTAQPGQAPPVPGPEHFRKMAIYIRDGRVVAVREVIEVEATQRLDELTVRLQDAGLRVPTDVSIRERISNSVSALNQLRVQNGLPPVLLRAVTLRLAPLGDGVSIALPADAVQGSLKGILERGQVLEQTD